MNDPNEISNEPPLYSANLIIGRNILIVFFCTSFPTLLFNDILLIIAISEWLAAGTFKAFIYKQVDKNIDNVIDVLGLVEAIRDVVELGWKDPKELLIWNLIKHNARKPEEKKYNCNDDDHLSSLMISLMAFRLP